MKYKGFIKLTILYALTCTALTYKPVIVIHGLLDRASSMDELRGFIEQAHPGTEVYLIDLYDDYKSFTPMWQQVESVQNVTVPIMRKAKGGVHVIGYSQGGLTARGLIHTTDEHNVANFISVSSPLNGQYGDTYYFKWLPKLVKSEMYRFFYTAEGQRWSVGNYWKDPHKFEMYRHYSEYLGPLNNETDSQHQKFRDSWKTNFQRLKRLVLIGGPADDVIAPWQSAQFGFYDENEEVVPMRSQQIYRTDLFGLSTLDRRGAINICTVPGVRHLQWHRNRTVFEKCIAPYLD